MSRQSARLYERENEGTGHTMALDFNEVIIDREERSFTSSVVATYDLVEAEERCAVCKEESSYARTDRGRQR